jgi:hypothetical protein
MSDSGGQGTGGQGASSSSEKKPIEAAIAVVEDSRRTHVEWLTWLEQAAIHGDDYVCREPGCGADHRNDVKIAGDAVHHRRCIEGYDLVLRVLRDLEGESQVVAFGRWWAALKDKVSR